MTDYSRVVLVAPHRTVEMALPASVPLADLMPVLVQRITTDLRAVEPDGSGRNRALSGDGDWILQRLGGGPLDDEQTPAALEIRDGETLYLRPRDSALPPVHFDDLIDGIATGIRDRPDRWRDGMTRALFLLLAAAAQLTCFAVLLQIEVAHRGGLAAGGAVALVLAATMSSRAVGDGWAAIVLGVGAVPFAWLAGFSLVLPPSAPAATRLLCAAVAASAVALLVTVAVGQHRALFLAAWLVSLAVAGYAVLMVLGLTPARAAASIVTLTLLASAAAPSVAFRLALFRLPQMPTSAADLSDDIEPIPTATVLPGTVVADGYLTWLLIAAGLVSTAGVIVVAPAAGWAPASFVIAVGGVLAIRSRGLGSAWQRGATLLPVVVTAAMIFRRLGAGSGAVLGTLVVLGLLVVTVVLVALSRTMPGRRLLPYWSRLADFVEYLVATAMVLLLLAVLDVFGWARAIAG